jgi:hypothetical protein
MGDEIASYIGFGLARTRRADAFRIPASLSSASSRRLRRGAAARGSGQGGSTCTSLASLTIVLTHSTSLGPSSSPAISSSANCHVATAHSAINSAVLSSARTSNSPRPPREMATIAASASAAPAANATKPRPASKQHSPSASSPKPKPPPSSPISIASPPCSTARPPRRARPRVSDARWGAARQTGRQGGTG